VDRRAIFDIYCEGENGDKFIVELQKAKQNFFKDRTVFYSTFPIQQQAEQGEWNYELKAVYCVGVLDFTFDDYETEPERSEVLHVIQLKNQRNRVFYDKLSYIYLEMPNFRKGEDELETRLDKWLYFLRHLVEFSEIPRIFGGEDVFRSAFEKAALANLNRDEERRYQDSLKVYRDLKGVVDTARDEGRAEGVEQGRAEGVEQGLQLALERLIASGMPEAEARRALGLS
jgi:predicted transposase/invertase (TIGR01784 family)